MHVPKARRKIQLPSGRGPRTVLEFDHDWKFSKGDFISAMGPAFDDSNWRSVSRCRTTGALKARWGRNTRAVRGRARRHRMVSQILPTRTGCEDQRLHREFDGIYDNSEVWFNGQLVGGRPYGYSAFECDLTP